MQRPDPRMNEIEETLDRIDEDRDRSISFDEFKRLMLDIDHTRPLSALRARFAAMDLDRDGKVSYEEFRAWCSLGR